MTITGTNIFVLAKHASAGFPAKVAPSHLSHLKRCIAAGLLVVDRSGQRLSADGQAAVARAAKVCICGAGHDCRATGCDDSCEACG